MTRQSPILAALAIAAIALAGCHKTPATNTAYNNSGSSATPGSSVTAPATSGSTDTTTSSTTTTGSTDTSSGSSTASSSMPSSTTASSGDTSSPASSTSSTAGSSNPSSGTTNVVTDTVATGKIKAALASENGLKDADISVDNNGGVVTLKGTAKSQEQIALATSVAQRQQGVTRVDSQLTVK
jgi:osmotically-inducible protein OsmY